MDFVNNVIRIWKNLNLNYGLIQALLLTSLTVGLAPSLTVAQTTCSTVIENKTYYLPHEAISDEPRALEMHWNTDSQGRLIQVFSKATPKSFLKMTPEQTTLFLSGKLSLPVSWMQTNKNPSDKIYPDLSYATEGSPEFPYPAQFVVNQVLLPIKVANKMEWSFSVPSKEDAGLLWPHAIEDHRILRSDILGRWPESGRIYKRSIRTIDLIQDHSIVHKSTYLKFEFLGEEFSLPLFIYKEEQRNWLIERPTHFSFELATSSDGQRLLLRVNVEPLFRQQAPVEVVLSSFRKEWLKALSE